MANLEQLKVSVDRLWTKGWALGALLALNPAAGFAEIIWNGDFSTGDFTQYHSSTDSRDVYFHLIPEYGRPIQYGRQMPGHVGNGDLLSLVAKTSRTMDGVHYPQGPTRGADYAAKLTIKNSINGSEPADNDPTGDPNRRRTQFQLQKMLSEYYNAIPHMSERWLSYSVYLPSNWEERDAGWGPSLFGIKPRNDGGGVSGTLRVSVAGNGWSIWHRWANVKNPSGSDVPWQYQMFYSGNHEGTGRAYPNEESWPDGLRHFPDVKKSHAALQSLNKGGWTDWVFHIKTDHRGASAGGTGWATIWKREDSGPWIKVLDIRPGKITRGGITFDHGIGYNVPAEAGNNGGYGMNIGLGGHKDQYWGAKNNIVVYMANVKIGDAGSTFSDMSPDGSTPYSEGGPEGSPPRPPVVLDGN